MIPIPHSWDMEPQDAITLQKELARHIDTTTPIKLDAVRTVGGVDVSVKNGISRAAVVVLSYPDLGLIEAVTASIETPFPYISGLLSFREGEAILKAADQLKQWPDAFIFDGQGIIHPRRLGIAAHIGLWWAITTKHPIPTIGCGKTWLIGDYDEPAAAKGSYADLTHQGEVIGVALRTRTNVKPVFVSAGHYATLDTARDLLLTCSPRYRLPEPVRAAHQVAGDH